MSHDITLHETFNKIYLIESERGLRVKFLTTHGTDRHGWNKGGSHTPLFFKFVIKRPGSTSEVLQDGGSAASHTWVHLTYDTGLRIEPENSVLAAKRSSPPATGSYAVRAFHETGELSKISRMDYRPKIALGSRTMPAIEWEKTDNKIRNLENTIPERSSS